MTATQWLQPSQYWTGNAHATRYICWYCANWYDTAAELRDHLEGRHPDVTTIIASSDPLR